METGRGALKISPSSLAGAHANPRVVEKLAALDTNGDGQLDIGEVCAAVEQLSKAERERRYLKWAVIIAAGVCLLTVAATAGLTYAVVALSQEIDTSDSGTLLVAGTNTPVAVASSDFGVGAGGALEAKQGGGTVATAQATKTESMAEVLARLAAAPDADVAAALSALNSVTLYGAEPGERVTVLRVGEAAALEDGGLRVTSSAGTKAVWAADGTLTVGNATGGGRRLLGSPKSDVNTNLVNGGGGVGCTAYPSGGSTKCRGANAKCGSRARGAAGYTYSGCCPGLECLPRAGGSSSAPSYSCQPFEYQSDVISPAVISSPTVSPNGGDCCARAADYGLVGCVNQVCASAVCGYDSFCCQYSWDGLCAREAATLSAAECGCPAPPKGSCCEASWDAPNAGCTDAACEAAVLAVRADCAIFWSYDCKAQAQALCPKLCPPPCEGKTCPCAGEACNTYLSTSSSLVCDNLCYGDWECLKCDPCAQPGGGPLNFTLSWDGDSDLDLQVVANPAGCGSDAADACPAAKACPSCYLGSWSGSACGGTHSGDVLCCAAGPRGNAETAAFAVALAAPSTYGVTVYGYACGGAPLARWMLSVNGVVWKTGNDGYATFTWPE